jgi:hypothetical protein
MYADPMIRDLIRKEEKAMSEETSSASVKTTRGLPGAIMKSMALTASPPFLWIAYRLQTAAAAAGVKSISSGIWASIAAALIVALLTALRTRVWQRPTRKQVSSCPLLCKEGPSGSKKLQAML